MQMSLCGLILISTFAPAARSGTPATTLPASPTTQPLDNVREVTGVANFARVSAIVYRGDHVTAEGFATLKKLGFKTVVEFGSFLKDRKLLAGTGMRYGPMPDRNEKRFLKIIDDAENQPVFLDCDSPEMSKGYLMLATFRIVRQSWSVVDAVDEFCKNVHRPDREGARFILEHLDVHDIEAELVKTQRPKLDVIE